MNEDEIIKNLNDLLEHNYLEDVGYLREENDYVVYNNAIQGLLDLCQQEKEKNSKIQKYVRSNEWAEDYEKSSCRAKILRILEGN